MTKEQIIATAVECFDLGPEDQDAVLRFGMKLQDMEDAERKAQPSVEEVMEEVSLWYADPQRVAPGVTMHDNWKMLRDRLTRLFKK